MKYLRPSFLIIGERKCGTSSLYRYLLAHPNVLPCKLKEPQFFVRKPWDIWWSQHKYYRLFPTEDYQGNIEIEWPELDKHGQLYTEKLSFERQPNQHYITGEASAETFFRGKPQIVRRYLPDAKLILMLRNPVERTFSHYRMLERYKLAGRQLKVPISTFEADMKKGMERIQKGEKDFFLSPSIYYPTLKKWLNIYTKDQIYIIRTTDLTNPNMATQVMKELGTFLNLPNYDFSSILQQQFNKAPSKAIPSGVGEELTQFFKPYNERLETLLDRKMYW